MTGGMPSDGARFEFPNRADEVSELLNAVQELIVPFIHDADADALVKRRGRSLSRASSGGSRTTLVNPLPPNELKQVLAEPFPKHGAGKEGLLRIIARVLEYSVNTWDQGFLDKLYGSTDAVGVVSDLVLSVLNTNVHVYQVAPALTVIENETGRFLAEILRFPGPHAGAISLPGGSFANHTALLIARNTLYPVTKTDGVAAAPAPLVAFTSAHCHYSVEKAAQMAGLGTRNLCSVPVDSQGRMDVAAFKRMIVEVRGQGKIPFFVNATAGTTVLGTYDPLPEIADVCDREGMWLHVDGSWGGGVMFCEELARKGGLQRLNGVERARTVTMSPHKMLGVPVTCSVLVGQDLREFEKAMKVGEAGYLFHDSLEPELSDGSPVEYHDLGMLTPACGRRSDMLKLYISLRYHGLDYYSSRLRAAFDNASHLDSLLRSHPHILAISPAPLPCLQVCFYWARDGVLDRDPQSVSKGTQRLAKGLVDWGWMIDFAPGERGAFMRVVVGLSTVRETVEGLMKAIEGVALELGL